MDKKPEPSLPENEEGYSKLTDTQKKYLDLFNTYNGNVKKIAEVTGISCSTIYEHIKKIKDKKIQVIQPKTPTPNAY